MTLDDPDGAVPGYAEAFFGLRAPRVAIVFPADTQHWIFFAQAALWEANQIWGGAGFVLVPHQDGKVSVNLLQAVAAYDPDYVVAHRVTWHELLAGKPNAMPQIVDGAGIPVSPERRADLLASMTDEDAADWATDGARDAVAAVCEVYRRRNIQPAVTEQPSAVAGPTLPRWDGPWEEPDESMRFLRDANLTRVESFGIGDDMCLAAPDSLTGHWGAMTAAIVGAARRPSPPGSASGPAPDQAQELASWFYGRFDRTTADLKARPPSLLAHHHDGLKLGVDTTTLPAAWSKTTTGLAAVGEALHGRRTTLVVGDTAEDFALALICDRVWGNSLWMHSDWSPDAAGEVGATARRGLQHIGWRVRGVGQVVFTSASKSVKDVEKIVQLLAPQSHVSLSLEVSNPSDEADNLTDAPQPTDGKAEPKEAQTPVHHRSRPPRTPLIEVPVDFGARGKIMLAAADDFATRIALPVLRDEEAVVLATTPPVLRPSEPRLAANDGLAWHVDIRLSGTEMPRGRGLDGHVLAATPDEQYETWIRSGNRGVSFENRRWDFVPAGSNLEQQLARPRIRFLTLLAWCRAMAAQAGYDIGWSDAGRRARLLEQMWGGRPDLVKDFARDFVELTELFNRTAPGTNQAYPDAEGVLIRGVGGFLNFKGLRSVLAPESTTTPAAGHEPPADRSLVARTRIDSFVRRGIIRRGLLLVCATCEQPNFVPIQDLGQRNNCARCGALTDLTLGAWRQPVDEPTWFYDLHQVARGFVKDNGHAPLWLAHHLATQARAYSDCAELNLLKAGTRTSLAEVDLIAHVDGKLITAEVKTSNSLASRAQRTDAARKRVHWAAVLRADEVLLATTQPDWQPSSISAVADALKAATVDSTFAPDRTPRLRLVTGLGTATLTDQYHDA
ncbi:hypothetical protein EV643_12692 [Kribbella sp. VKM Ac-2527]|uniref:Uncharacterized protein n=1 Tax=Kribbella caucasensis TaxID=2512215 RepID=A0A4R6JGC8_9ACTN|nr:hypothetical protein [Kribbella sp. VKM Ac-2527]TDO34732.1 hypothetical protein EV643_12692 [Kribbella sp. VKM Ac-2527]